MEEGGRERDLADHRAALAKFDGKMPPGGEPWPPHSKPPSRRLRQARKREGFGQRHGEISRPAEDPKWI